MTTNFRTKLSYALSLAVALALLLAPLALADVVMNDAIGSTDNDTIIAGIDATTVRYWIKATTGDSQSGCNAADSTPATVMIHAPDSVSISPASLTFNRCTETYAQNVTFSSPRAGNFDITVTVADGGVGTYNYEQAKFTLHVLDITPPVITFEISGSMGEYDWYTSDVFVDWTVTDPESDVVIDEGCVDTLINNDTTGTLMTCEAHSLGGSSSEEFSIKRDATPPVVSLLGGPDHEASYYYGDTPAEPTCDASDAMSGLDSCIVEGYSNLVGAHTVTASAKDLAGNTATDTATYTVLAWDLFGFYAPVDMGGVFNVVKGGSTVPLKFEVFKGASELTDTTIVASFVQQINCPVDPLIDAVEVTATGGTSLRYDDVEGQFLFNWQTPKIRGACYKVTMTTQDASDIEAFFQLK